MIVPRLSARYMSSGPIKSSLMLSRIPIVTRALNPFEKEYFNYQAELERRLMRTFPQYYYFKKGTLAERKFLDIQNGVISKQPNVWYPKGIPDVKHGRDRRFKQNILIPGEEANKNDEKNLSRPIEVNARVTEADKTNNMSSLNRKLSHTLYLIVKEKDQWKFPSFNLESQSLHTAAEKGLVDLGGNQIKIWTVSNTPAAVIKYCEGELVAPTYESPDERIERHYIIKSHIVAGSFQPMNIEYKWVTNDEAASFFDNSYFQQVRHLLANF